MKRRIFSAILALVLVMSMAIPAMAASSYTYEGDNGGRFYQFTGSCTTTTARASTCYSTTDVLVSTRLVTNLDNGDSTSYTCVDRTLVATVTYTASSSRTISSCVCTFTVSGVKTTSITLSPA